jgi:hypothetical protein
MTATGVAPALSTFFTPLLAYPQVPITAARLHQGFEKYRRIFLRELATPPLQRTINPPTPTNEAHRKNMARSAA